MFHPDDAIRCFEKILHRLAAAAAMNERRSLDSPLERFCAVEHELREVDQRGCTCASVSPTSFHTINPIIT